MSTLIQLAFSSDLNASAGPIHLPGLTIPNTEDYGLLDYKRYVADEGLRINVNALLARGVIVTAGAVDEKGDETDFPAEFPVLTALERELRERPRVPELGAVLTFADTPPNENVPLGSALLYFKKVGTAAGELWVKAKGACAVATFDLSGGGTWKAIARQAGTAGNSLRVKVLLVADASYSSLVEGNDITFTLPDDGGNLATMAIQDFVAAVNADASLQNILAAAVGENSSGEAMNGYSEFTSLADGSDDVYDALIVFD